ncbi:unnamed protein product [Malus baccata var. baccata]
MVSHTEPPLIGTVVVFQVNHALSCVFFCTWHCVIDLGDRHREIPGSRFFSYVGLGVALFMDPENIRFLMQGGDITKDSISLRRRLKMSGEALQVAKVYCHLLKAVKKHVAKEENKRHFIKYTTEEFRNNCKLSDPSSIQHKIKLAENYTLLLNSVHHHKDLFSYNIAVDRTDEMKRVLGKSAASVGLQLPDVYQP